MQQLLYVFCNLVNLLLTVLQLLMFVRAIASWIMPDGDNAFINFVNTVTEPLIYPVRALLERFEFVRNMPIDISFFVTYLILVAVQAMLPKL